jgi:heme A synthase
MTFPRFAWLVTGYNLLVILWGAFVRITGAGAGCGSHWPLCNGEVLPREPSAETLIELSHRLSSGLDGLLVVALVVATFRLFPPRHRVRRAAVASLVFLVIEALVGAGLVRFELVVHDDSALRAVVIALHLANTFFLLAALAATALWAGGLPASRRAGGGTLGALLGTTALLVLTGMSGAVTALGDTLFPAREFAWDQLSAASHFLLRLRVIHPVVAVVAGLVVLTVAALPGFRRAGAAVPGAVSAVQALVLLQLAAGFINVQLAAPVWLQLVHLLLADLLWLAWVALGMAVLAGRYPPAAGTGVY